MSLIKANAVQIGQSPTATQNFTLAVPSSPDGTIKLARGNSGATTQDVISVDASGNINGLVKSTSSTTARSLANRFADVVNVKDFGAVGDGIADDTAAIQASVNYGSSNSKVVYISSGTYVSGKITVPSNIDIFGDGIESTTLFCKANTNATILNAANSDFVQISNIKFDYNTPNNNGSPAPGESQSGVGVRNNCIVSECEFVGCVGAAIIGYGSNNEISNNRFNNGAYSAPVNASCVALFGATGLSRNVISQNIAIGIANGFSVNNTGTVGEENKFINNYISGTFTTSLSTTIAGAINAWKCKKTIISGNTAINCNAAGIRLIDGSQDSIVVNNKIENCGLGGTAGIDVGDSNLYLDKNLIISNNNVIGTGGPGFWLTSVYNSIISNNVSSNNGITTTPPPSWITDFWKAGIVVASESDSSTTPITNNIFIGNSCQNNYYAISRTGNNPNVVTLNQHIGNDYSNNFTSSYNYSPTTDVYTSNKVSGQKQYIYDWSYTYGNSNGAIYNRVTNSTTGKKVEFGFDNNFASNPGVVIQSSDSIGFASGTGDDVSGNRKAVITSAGNLGIGNMSPTYQLQLATDSAAKPSTNTWTISSDERIKENIELANIDICFDVIKNLPLKRYKWKDEIYSHDQVQDRTKLGWIAQDVKNVFPKATVEKDEIFSPTGKKEDEIEIKNCLSLNADQIYAALYGAVQKLIEKNENQETLIQELSAKVEALESK